MHNEVADVWRALQRAFHRAPLFLLGIPLLCPSAQAQAPFARGLQPPHPAVVRVVATEPNGSSHGSGTLVDVQAEYGLVVTNWHVVRDSGGEVTVFFPSGFRSAARILKIDRDWDLAALLIWKPPVEAVRLSHKAPQPGEVLTIAGYGSGNYRAVSGRCTQYVAPAANLPYEMVEVSAQARQGDSGGPIFNQQGELAGVLFGAGRGTTSGSYAGRVRLFLAGCWPALDQPDRATIAARQTPATQNRPTEPLVALPGPLARENSVARQNSQPRQTAEPAAAAVIPGDAAFEQFAPYSGGADTSASLTWDDIAGESPYEQLKTVFAAIGLMAIVLTVMRWAIGKDS